MATFRRDVQRRRGDAHSRHMIRKIEKAVPAMSPRESLDMRGTRHLTILQLLNRDGEQCYLCGKELRSDLQVEHIIARKNGGSDHPLNLALACKTCNVRKRDMVVAFTIADRRPFFLLP